MDNFDYWTEAELQKACKFGFTVAGGVVGGAVGALSSGVTGGTAAPITVPAGAAYGAALGLATGLLVCSHVSKDKVEQWLSGQPQARADAVEVLSGIARMSAARSKDEVLWLAMHMRQAYTAGPMTSAQPSSNHLASARTLLALPGLQRV